MEKRTQAIEDSIQDAENKKEEAQKLKAIMKKYWPMPMMKHLSFCKNQENEHHWNTINR